jgi:hypothetical protein
MKNHVVIGVSDPEKLKKIYESQHEHFEKNDHERGEN